ncbi:MAG TPA: ParB N-terminal domain-containing protein [Vicinamibacterales bacterium]|nr:ParB N-terminal domain-containing protein [Vicinamibacterales bacterium]
MPASDFSRPSPMARPSDFDAPLAPPVPELPDDDLPEAPPAREGLPRGYRMRADAHYVDQLVSRRHADPLQLIPVGRIDGPHPMSGDLQPLIRSIRQHGILQPLIVRRQNGRYELIAGSRRLAAAMAAGIEEVPCLVRAGDDEMCRELADAANLVHGAGRADILPSPGPEALTAAGFPELMEHLGSITACLHLFPERERPMRERVAFGLIRAEVQRAAWLAQALAVLTTAPSPARTPVDLRAVVRRVAAAMEPERQLCGVEIDLRLGSPTPVQGDEPLLAVAVAGVVGAMQALVERAGGRRVRLSVEPTPAKGGRVVIAPEACDVPEAAAAAFLDPGWRERPGGAAASVGVAAASRIADLHGGRLAMSGGEGQAAVIEIA